MAGTCESVLMPAQQKSTTTDNFSESPIQRCGPPDCYGSPHDPVSPTVVRLTANSHSLSLTSSPTRNPPIPKNRNQAVVAVVRWRIAFRLLLPPPPPNRQDYRLRFRVPHQSFIGSQPHAAAPTPARGRVAHTARMCFAARERKPLRVCRYR
eukprot:356460-Chlamydomonas_euryale.AAC.12